MAVILTSSAGEQAALRGQFLVKTAVVRSPSSPNKPRRPPSVVHGEAVLFFGREAYGADSLYHDCGGRSTDQMDRFLRQRWLWGCQSSDGDLVDGRSALIVGDLSERTPEL
ncbi:MAG: hypothetical protein OXF98_04415, partial [Rhodospirillaceae bacterium]|nr:hypothetical protein [Rhodospirillaceae bacterium]